MSTQMLTPSVFDKLVTRWNGLKRFERTDRASACKSKGHDWAEAPFSEEDSRAFVCKRCLRYDMGN